MRWTKERFSEAIDVLSVSHTLYDAAEVLTSRWGSPVSKDALHMAFGRQGRKAGAYLSSQKPESLVVDYKTEDNWEYSESSGAIVNGWMCLAFSADWHVGSKHCAETAILGWQRFLYAAGARTHFIAGDWSEGAYYSRGGQHSLTEVGIDAQVSKTLELLEQRPGLVHYYIDGNHDKTFGHQVGCEAGEYLESSAIAMGRSDIKYLGYQSGRTEIGGIDVELVHYRRGVYMAPSKYLANRPDSDLPDILCGGHYHIDDVKSIRNVLCIQPGSFQYETPFMAGTRIHPTGGRLVWINFLQSGHRRYLTEWVPEGAVWA